MIVTYITQQTERLKMDSLEKFTIRDCETRFYEEKE